MTDTDSKSAKWQELLIDLIEGFSNKSSSKDSEIKELSSRISKAKDEICKQNLIIKELEGKVAECKYKQIFANFLENICDKPKSSGTSNPDNKDSKESPKPIEVVKPKTFENVFQDLAKLALSEVFKGLSKSI